MNDEIERRLRSADPARDAPVKPTDGVDSELLRRTIMSSDEVRADDPRSSAGRPAWRQPFTIAAVGAAAAAAVVVTVVAVSGGDDPAGTPTTATYALPDAGGPMGMCLPVSDIEPIPGAAALAGTVVSVDGTDVVLEVDRWYAGGTAERVALQGTGQSVALDGVEFVQGEDYLVTAADGVVQVCGMSGPATPELADLYDQWYG